MIKNKIILLLLLSISFSILHGMTSPSTDSHCDVKPYLQESSYPLEHCDEHEEDSCDGICLYHLPYLLPHYSYYLPKEIIRFTHPSITLLYSHSIPLELFKPPII